MTAFNLVTDLKGLNKAVRESLSDVGGVKSPEMKATAGVLAKHMRRTLSVRGGARIATSLKTRKLTAIGGTPSKAGEPPRRQTSQFAKSVKTGPVGVGWRVGVLRFTGLMLEAGVKAVLGARKIRARRGGLRRERAGTVQRSITIPARPYLLKSVDSAKDEMATKFGDLAGLSIKASS
jgi:hypothetical protein